ncbi:hypothetical protein EYF80_029830 [Liparis tanakae]|uniref:Uncharacterized protein n=1 Tax=Liparis tanakae TaxID=230148 RepID=A0A4Z2H288_9TELE|nr:hypothetical protein EYF80_029830 [Liparis tanakae]
MQRLLISEWPHTVTKRCTRHGPLGNGRISHAPEPISSELKPGEGSLTLSRSKFKSDLPSVGVGWRGREGVRLGEGGGGGGYRDGCRPRLGRAQCQCLSGTPFFLGACSAPSWGPSRVQGYMVSARQVHLPHYLCPAHASTLPSPSHHPPITCSTGTLWK